MHDAFGRELKVGDRVMVPMVIEELHLTADYCNVKVTSVATMPPDHQSRLTISAINTQQLLRANDGDDLEYRTRREPPSIVKLVQFSEAIVRPAQCQKCGAEYDEPRARCINLASVNGKVVVCGGIVA